MKKMLKMELKRTLAFVLALLMAFSLIPETALYADTIPGEEEPLIVQDTGTDADLNFRYSVNAGAYQSLPNAVTMEEGDNIIVTSTANIGMEAKIFGYVTLASGDALTFDSSSMHEIYQTGWNENYAEEYGPYGSDGKYYCFSWLEEDGSRPTYEPQLYAQSAGKSTITYTYIGESGDILRTCDVTVTESESPTCAVTVEYELVDPYSITLWKEKGIDPIYSPTNPDGNKITYQVDKGTDICLSFNYKQDYFNYHVSVGDKEIEADQQGYYQFGVINTDTTVKLVAEPVANASNPVMLQTYSNNCSAVISPETTFYYAEVNHGTPVVYVDSTTLAGEEPQFSIQTDGEAEPTISVRDKYQLSDTNLIIYNIDICDLYGDDYTGYTITVRVGGVDYNFYFKRTGLKYKKDNEAERYLSDFTSLSYGDTISLSESMVGSTLGYVDLSTAQAVQVKPLSTAAQKTWNAQYKSKYGTYGANGKYYLFRSGDTAWPQITVTKTNVNDTVRYFYNIDGTQKVAYYNLNTCDALQLEYDGKLLASGNDSYNFVPFQEQTVRAYLCRNGERIPASEASRYEITPYDSYITTGLDEEGIYVEISPSEETNYASMWFNCNVLDKQTNNCSYINCRMFNSLVRLWNYPDLNQGVTNGQTYEVDFNNTDLHLESDFFYQYLDETVTDVKVTSSATAVVAVHGSYAKHPQVGDNGEEYESFSCPFLELKKLGTSKITVSYKENGTAKSMSFFIKVTSEPEMTFGYYDEHGDFVPFTSGETVNWVIGNNYEIDANVSPRLLSGISVTSSNQNVAYMSGSLKETCTVQCSENGWYHLSTTRSHLYACMRSLGTTKLTLRATYNGKAYSQTITVNCVSPSGLNLRQVYYYDDAENNNISDGSVRNLYLYNTGLSEFAIFNDVNGENVIDDVSKYQIDFYGVDWDTNNYGPVEDGTFEIIESDHGTFYINTIGEEFINDGSIVISSREASGSAITIPYEYRPTMSPYFVYESYEGEVLSRPVVSIDVVEGMETEVYLQLPSSCSVDDLDETSADWAAERGFHFEHEWANEEQKVVRVKISYDGSVSDAYSGTCFGVRSVYGQYWEYCSNCVDLIGHSAGSKKVPYASQEQLSDFLNTEGSAADIEGGIRINDYEVALKTDAAGNKAIVLVGYLGDSNTVWMPTEFTVNQCLNENNPVTMSTKLPVAGMEDGIFDTSKGYTQPGKVWLLNETYTYYGKDLSGYVDGSSGKRTYYYLDETDTPVDGGVTLYASDGMLFIVTSDGTYQCLDTGNRSFQVVAEDEVSLYRKRTDGGSRLELVSSKDVAGYILESDYLADEAGDLTPIKIEEVDGSYFVSIDRTKATEEEIGQLKSGNYYATLTPYMEFGQDGDVDQVIFPSVQVEIVINFDDEVPVVTAQSSVTINTFFKSDAVVKLDIANSFDTEVTDIQVSENDAGISAKNMDGEWFLCWDGTTEIKKNTKITLDFTVDGFVTDDENKIASQTITVSGSSVQPTTSLSAASVKLSTYPYEAQEGTLTIKNNYYTEGFDLGGTEIECTTVPKGGDPYDIWFDLHEDGNYAFGVSNNAVNGTYKVTITPRLQTKEELYAKAVTLTITVSGKKPTIKFSGSATVGLNAYLYNTNATLPTLTYANASSEALCENGVVRRMWNGASEADGAYYEITSHPKMQGDDEPYDFVGINLDYGDVIGTGSAEDGAWTDEYYALENLTFTAWADAAAPAGNYVFNIYIPLEVNSDVVWATAKATVKVARTLPSYKLSTSSLNLDAAYTDRSLQQSYAETELLIDDGMVLKGVDYTASAVNAFECIGVEYTENGKIIFKIANSGLKAGNYTFTLTPHVFTAKEEWIDLAPVKVTIKVTTSAKATISNKNSSITVNPYVGYAESATPMTEKNGISGADGVWYEVIPTSANAQENARANEEQEGAGFTVGVRPEDGIVSVENAKDAADGTYTYNIVKVYEKDGVITYSQPYAFKVVIKTTKLTVTPAKTSVTLYKEFTSAEDGYYVFDLPVTCSALDADTFAGLWKEDPEEVQNSLKDKNGVITELYTASGIVYLRVKVPTDVASVKNMVVTPVAEGVAFNTFKLSVNVKSGTPSTSFETANVAWDLNKDTAVTNTLKAVEGTEMFADDALTVVSVTKKGSKTDVQEHFDISETVEADGSVKVTVSVKDSYYGNLTDGQYTVKVKPNAIVNGKSEPLSECKFDFTISHPVTLSLGEDMTKKGTVNLYPELGELEGNIKVNAYDGEQPLEISKIEVSKTSGNADVNDPVTDAEQGMITFETSEDAKNAKNVYSATVYVKDANGCEVLAGTLSKAITVQLKSLPTSVSLTSAKVNYAPYLSENATVSVNNAELASLIESGRYVYEITAQETTNRYKPIEDENGVIALGTGNDGEIIISASQLPEKNASYYYLLTINFKKSDPAEGDFIKQYTAKLQVNVQGTKPAAAFQAATVDLNSTYVNRTAGNAVTLTSGSDLWKLDKFEDWDIQVTTSKKKDVTELKYFTIDGIGSNTDADAEGEGADGSFTIKTNNTDKDGKYIYVPNDTYKVIVTPKASAIFGDAEIELAPITLSVKVTSNRPTVRYSATSVKVNTYTNAPAEITMGLSNGGNFEPSYITCTSAPKNVDVDSLNSNDPTVHVALDEDGFLTAYADRDAVAGAYKFNVQPVTNVNGTMVVLDSKVITVTVNATMPKASLSSSKVTVNSKFAQSYEASIQVTSNIAGTYTFTKDAIETTDTKDATKKVSVELLKYMTVEQKDDGSAIIKVALPQNEILKNGTYSFKVTPEMKSGNSEETYALNPVAFKVVIEDKMPTVSAKISGSADLVKRYEGVAVQIKFNNETYDGVANITDVKIIDPATGEISDDFEIGVHRNGSCTIFARYRADLKVGSYKENLLVTTEIDGVERTYTTAVTIKTTQTACKVSAAQTNTTMYSEIGEAYIPLNVTEGVGLQYIDLTKATATVKNGKRNVTVTLTDYFDAELYYDEDGVMYAHVWTTKDLPENVTSGTAVTMTFSTEPDGNAVGKSAISFTGKVTVK